MPNTQRIMFSPVKRRSVAISPNPTGDTYHGRLLHTGLISQVDSSTQFTALNSNIPGNVPPGVDLSTPLASNPPHINPKGLTYVVRIVSETGAANDQYHFLTSAVNSGPNTIVQANTASFTSAIEGSRFDILMPIDDGVRYQGEVASYAGTDIVCLGGNNVSELGQVLTDSTFDVIVMRADQTYERKLITSLSFTNNTSAVTITVDSPFTTITPSGGDLVIVKSTLWSSFCNPNPDADSALSTNFFDTGNAAFVQSPMFDYEMTHSTGEFQWFGNTIFGVSDAGEVSVGAYNGGNPSDDKGDYSTSLPNIPYAVNLKVGGTALGSVNFITEEQADILTSGSQDATSLHNHDSRYYLKSETYNQSEFNAGTSANPGTGVLDPRYYTKTEVYTKTEASSLFLTKSANLSDLGNAATARNNLSVYSKTEIDNQIKEIPIFLYTFLNVAYTNSQATRDRLQLVHPASLYKEGQKAIVRLHFQYSMAIGAGLLLDFGHYFWVQGGVWRIDTVTMEAAMPGYVNQLNFV